MMDMNVCIGTVDCFLFLHLCTGTAGSGTTVMRCFHSEIQGMHLQILHLESLDKICMHQHSSCFDLCLNNAKNKTETTKNRKNKQTLLTHNNININN